MKFKLKPARNLAIESKPPMHAATHVHVSRINGTVPYEAQ